MRQRWDGIIPLTTMLGVLPGKIVDYVIAMGKLYWAQGSAPTAHALSLLERYLCHVAINNPYALEGSTGLDMDLVAVTSLMIASKLEGGQNEEGQDRQLTARMIANLTKGSGHHPRHPGGLTVTDDALRSAPVWSVDQVTSQEIAMLETLSFTLAAPSILPLVEEGLLLMGGMPGRPSHINKSDIRALAMAVVDIYHILITERSSRRAWSPLAAASAVLTVTHSIVIGAVEQGLDPDNVSIITQILVPGLGEDQRDEVNRESMELGGLITDRITGVTEAPDGPSPFTPPGW